MIFSKQTGTHRGKPFPAPMLRFLDRLILRTRTQDPESSVVIPLVETNRAEIRAREVLRQYCRFVSGKQPSQCIDCHPATGL